MQIYAYMHTQNDTLSSCEEFAHAGVNELEKGKGGGGKEARLSQARAKAPKEDFS